jgi:RNA polymerase sigma-70 factor (ECF subfamily)
VREAIGYLGCAPAAATGVAGAWAASVNEDQLTEFEGRVRECHRLVFQVAFGVLRDAADAEETAQDAFLRAYRKLSSLREPEKFRSWVARTSFRLALNRRRAGARSRQRDTSWLAISAPPADNAEAIVAQRQFQLRLEQEIDRLPEKLRAVLLLSAVQELNARAIADMLDIPEGTVRSRLFLARKELLKVFSDETMR